MVNSLSTNHDSRAKFCGGNNTSTFNVQQYQNAMNGPQVFYSDKCRKICNISSRCLLGSDTVVMWKDITVSEDHVVSIFRMLLPYSPCTRRKPSETMVPYHIATLCHNTENRDLNLHCHENLKSSVCTFQ